MRTVISALILLLTIEVGQSDAQTLVLSNARLIIGDGTVVEQGSVLVEDGTIRAVGNLDQSDISGATVIELAGRTVMPAMIDAHAHLGFQGAATWGAENYGRDNLIDNLERYAFYGFGAVFSAGSDPAELMLALQADLDNGEFAGARPLFAAGMAPPGEGPNNQFLVQVLEVEADTGLSILYGLADTGAARAAVDSAAGRGYEFVKLWVDDRGGTQQKLAAPIYSAVADQAGQRGLRVFVHQQYAEDIAPLVEAGVHGFLHGRLGDGFTLGIARQLAQADVFVIPNLGLAELRREAIGDDPFLQQTMTLTSLDPMRATAAGRLADPLSDPVQEAELRASFQRLLEAGVDVVLGTDAGAVPNHPFGYTGHRELEIYVRLGMTPAQALLTATSVAARHLGLENMGLLAPGFRADMIVLEHNPLDDIRNTRSIAQVYLDGRVLDRESLQARWSDR